MRTQKLTQEDFLSKYCIDHNLFKDTGLAYNELTDIQEDFESRFQTYDDVGAHLVRMLLRYDGVHSVKYRIKDSEHLIEKIIRKRIEKPSIVIDKLNYQEKIQDLIGIRILHLFKSDWISIHETLKKDFVMAQRPEANIRKGDLDTHFKTSGCKIKIHKAGYRSVHYIIKYQPTRKSYCSEIQVRTIFEEAWSEVDHKIRYPYYLDNELINQYLQIFNRLAGGADEMADYVNLLKAESILKEGLIKDKNHEIERLRQKLDQSSLAPEEKQNVLNDLDQIRDISSTSSKLSDYYHQAGKDKKFINYIEKFNVAALVASNAVNPSTIRAIDLIQKNTKTANHLANVLKKYPKIK